jgi:hypothetical protein
MPAIDEYAEIASRLELYFDGLYNCDIALLAEIFHPQARYICASSEARSNLTRDEYLEIVSQRISPASRNEQRRDAIRAIRVAGSELAFAEVNCAIGTRYFTDFLTLIREDDRWQIIAKVFRLTQIQAPA